MTSLNSLDTICRDAHFTKRGRAYFRVIGDGVLQIVKRQYQRAFYADELCVGLLSMYSEMQPEWFTSFGCITRYPVVNCAMQKDIPLLAVPPMDEQVQMLQDIVLPWMDSIDAQKRLISAITKMDRRWNDSFKIAPYLACGETNHAKKVVREILAQHAFAYDNRSLSGDYPPSDVEEWEKQEDEDFYQLLKMIDRADLEEIHKFLQRNYEQNRVYAKFCIKER